jgi:hypothetical protein
MPGEGDIRADEESKDKKKRKVMEVLDQLDRGIRIGTVGINYDVNESTIY